MQRLVENRAGWPQFDGFPQVHDQEAAAQLPYDAQVMRDQNVRQPELPPKLQQQGDDLGLEREIERRGRLVEQKDLRTRCDGSRDRNALLLPSTELMRQLPCIRLPDSDEIEKGADGSLALAPRAYP